MMAKTFDSINETTISQIIFARFELALELDNESSFMPPPFNVFAMMGMIIFYIIEFIINHTIFCCSKKHHFDLCVLIMPNWLKHKKLELDSQIVGSKCHILTSEGDSIGLITSFDSDVHHHEITFYEDENEIGKKTALKKNVIIGNHINKKNKWNVDIFHLSQEKYLKLDQFSEKLTSDITLHFKQDSLKDRKKHHKSHHWICKYCRMYVKESKISVKRLGRELNVNDRDLKLLTNISPEICPNCYRVRHDTQRWRLIWEIISLYIYYLGVFPILFILFSLLLCISMIRNPHEAVHSFQIFRKHIHHYCKHITCCKSLRNIGNRYDSNTRAALKLMHAEDVHHEDSDSESSSSSDSDDDLNINYETMSVKQIKKIKSRRKDRKKDYVIGHYDSHELIHTLHHIGHGDTDELFDHSISADIWTNLSSSKKSIDLYIMRSRVSEHIISLSTEDEITQLDFYIDFINYEDINFTKWEILFKPFAHSIFSHIHDSREMELPLHLFAKYPMAPRMVLDDFEHWHHACENKDIKINECKSEDILNFLEEYGSLRCRDREEYKYLLHHICESDDYKHDHHTEYDQFVAYLKEVRLLFTETKKLKNLIRDVGIAILERGPDHEIIRQEIDLLFEEIPTSIVALPFFRAMKQETDIIKLWTIRNFLKVIYLLRALVKDTMLDMNPHVYVTKKLLIRLVFEKFKNKIVDKRNIMEQYMSKKKKRKLERIKTKIRFKLDTTSPNSPNIMNPNRNNSSDSDNFSSDEDSDEEEEEWKGHERSLKDDDSNSDENKNNNNNEINIKLKQIEIARFKKKRRETGHDHESDHSHDKREEMRLKRKKQLHKNQLRIKLLHTNRVTASTIAKVVGFIFDQIRFGRKKKAKITSSTMEHYQHKLPLGFRNNISLHFIYSQLCRYIIFKPYSLKQECTNTKLTEIITCIKYDSTHIIDIQSQPNYGNIENIYKHIKLIYDLSNIESKDKHPFMTIEDCVCCVLLFYRIFDNLSEKINGRSDEFVVTRPVFQKFCDRDNFRPGMDAEKWSKTAKEASNLFQSVLDTEQNYVTLGELRQTIIHLINDVDDMKSGHLIRIKNYLMERVQKDEDRRAKNLPKYKQKLLKWKQIHKNDIDNKSDDDDDDEKSELVSSKKNKKNNDKKAKKKPKNPKLQYAMINVANFSQFISKISEGYVPKIDGHKIVTKHNNNDEKKDDDNDNDEEYASDLFSRIASVAICVVDEKHDKISEDNEIETETETENKLQSDIEKMKKSLANLENDSEIKQEEEVKVEKKVEKKEKHNYFSDVTVDTKKMNRKYKTVYDYMLLKYEHRITLQQLIQYLRSLKRWLESNVYLITMIKNYDLAEDDTENEDLLFKLEEKMKKTKIGSYAQFFAKYFGNQCYKNKNFTKEEYLRHISKRDREIRWIFDQCHKEFDLIYLLTPFIHGKIIKEIDELLDSSDDVEGNYELRSEEFAQLKHQLHVNGHAAVQLFHIMRAHQQALSWKQILSYFIFLNKIKLVIDDCIRRNNKGEDADLSIDKMKLELHITSQDEANWLFQTVEHHHAQKVSWKHFRNYLNKSLMIRQDVKDFFDEQEAQHEYNENAYVLIQKLQQSVDNINNK